MRGTICGTQFTCSFHNRTVGVIGVQLVVGSIPHAGVFQDEVTLGVIRSNTIGSIAPYVVPFNPVTISVEEFNSPTNVSANRVFSNRVPITLAEAGTIKPDALVSIPADGTISNHVPIALAFVAIKIDALASIPADGIIGNGVPIARR